MSIARKAVKGGFWSGTSKVVQQISSIIVITILARLLSPDDFGLIAMVTVYIAFVTVFTSIGMGAAIINKREATQEQISTLYWLTFLLGFLSFLLIIASSPLALLFYNEPRLTNLIYILSLNALITPFYITHRRIFERDLKFSLLAKIDMISVFASGIVGVLCAFCGFGVYSLVVQSLSLNLFYLILINLKSNWKPEFVLAFSKVKSMIVYSMKYKGASLANYFERNIDYIILGRVFDAVTLGYYSFAYNIMYFPVKRISYVFTEILFPVFSTVKHNLEKVKEGYLRSIQLVAIVSFPLMTFIAIFSKPLIIFVFGEKWMPVSEIMAILAGAGAIQSIDQLSGALFPAVNKENIFLFSNWVRLVLTATAILIGSMFGLCGVAWALLIIKTVLFIINQILLRYYVKMNLVSIVKCLVGPACGCLLMVLFFFGMTKIQVNKLTMSTLLIQSIVIGAVYIIQLLLTNLKDIRYFISIVKSKGAN